MRSNAIHAPPESVLVLRFSSLGDVVLTSPAIEALHFAWPDTRIFFAVKERFAPLVAHNPHIQRVFALRPGEGALSFSRRIREERIGAVLDLHGKLRSKLVCALLPGVPRVVWHKRDFAEMVPVKLGLRPYHAPMHFAERYHLAVEKLVGRTLPRGKLRHFLGPDDLRLADAILAGAGLDARRPLLGLSPGSNWATKRWPVERFAELARRAIARGIQVAVQGSAEEVLLGRAVCALAPGAVDLCGKLDLRALGGFITRCVAFATNDSGPMHLARGLGVPTLAFFGSTDPGMFDFEGHAALFAGVSCSPCSYSGRSICPRGHFRCMRELDIDRAWAALLPLLEGGRRALASA
jgi:lipopolysaccharide heptosyltransferase II